MNMIGTVILESTRADVVEVIEEFFRIRSSQCGKRPRTPKSKVIYDGDDCWTEYKKGDERVVIAWPWVRITEGFEEEWNRAARIKGHGDLSITL